jgi:hypothetical protein
MTTFDDDLRLRLARLDAAMPGSVAPVFSTTARRTGPNRRRQGFILLAAAAIALFGLAGLTAVAVPTPPDPAVVARNAAD